MRKILHNSSFNEISARKKTRTIWKIWAKQNYFSYIIKHHLLSMPNTVYLSVGHHGFCFQNKSPFFSQNLLDKKNIACKFRSWSKKWSRWTCKAWEVYRISFFIMRKWSRYLIKGNNYCRLGDWRSAIKKKIKANSDLSSALLFSLFGKQTQPSSRTDFLTHFKSSSILV
jgi:hypothetical protein